MTASPTDAGAGMPSEEELTILIDQAAYYGADSRDVARDVLDRIRPAFEAKEREIERANELLKGDELLERCVKSAMLLDQQFAEIDELKTREAKLAQAVEDEREACATPLNEAAAALVGGRKRVPQVDYHVAGILDSKAAAIRARSASGRARRGGRGMIYVLLIIGLSYNTGNGSAEFIGKESCEYAAAQVRAVTSTTAAICVPKGPKG